MNAMSTRANLPLLEAINSGQPVMDAISDSARWSAGVVPSRPVATAGVGLGGQSIDRSTNYSGDVYTNDLDSYFAERERRAAIDGFAELAGGECKCPSSRPTRSTARRQLLECHHR